MNLIDYIRGNRRGREANSLEREALDDAFLTEAMEGYEAVYGDHAETLRRLEVWVHDSSSRRSQGRRRLFWGLLVAFLVVGGISVAALMLYSDRSTRQGASMEDVIDDHGRVETIDPSEFDSAMNGAREADLTVSDGAATGISHVEASPRPQNTVAEGISGVVEARRDTVLFVPFREYFALHRSRFTDADGQAVRGSVEVEFRVNDYGVPSAIRIISSFSREANGEVISLLTGGPLWPLTEGERIRIIVDY
jgi:hypothetical protein